MKNIDRALQAVQSTQIDAYQRDGAICLRQFLTQDEIAILRDGIEKNLTSPSSRAKVASKPNDPGWFIEDFCNWQTIPEYKNFIFNSPVSIAAGLLMNSQTSRLYHDHLLVKEPGTQQRTPWHQDQPYYNIEGWQNCSLWIPVDPVARHSSLEFIAGSHHGPWLMPRSFMDNQAKWFPEGSLADLPDIEANRKNFPIIGWDVEPGDIVCFHMLTLHSAGGVDGSRRRRVFSVRFIGDDITHAPRAWITSPAFPGLEHELPAQKAMNHSLFPLLWEKDIDEKKTDIILQSSN